MDLRTTIIKTLLGEEILQEETDKDLSKLWAKHAEYHHMAASGHYTEADKHEATVKKTHSHVLKHYGSEVASDMHKHSELISKAGGVLHSARGLGLDLSAKKEATRLRKKHNISSKATGKSSWRHGDDLWN
jgi:hypothetical protein